MTDLRSPWGNRHIERAIEFMRAYYSKGIKVKDICQAINLSPYYFIRLFKSQTGKTPHEYLLDIRLERAKVLLQEGGNSVEEVARLCGFINLGHFSSFFHRNVGLTPSEYRKKFIKGGDII